MELHALDRQRAMPHTHDFALGGARGHLEHRGHARGIGNQGMITPRLEPLRHAAEQPLGVVRDGRDLAVHQATGAHHLAAEHFDQGLMTETDAEYRQAACESLDHAHRDPRVARRTGARRDHQMGSAECQCLLHGDHVVAMHLHLRAQYQERLHQVVGERIVVVDQQHFRRAHRPSAAIASALRSTALFAMTSSNSAFGELSATMPPPA